MTSLSHLTTDFEQAAIQTEVPSFSTLTVGARDQLHQPRVKKNTACLESSNYVSWTEPTDTTYQTQGYKTIH
jgi:hypothetical protein